MGVGEKMKNNNFFVLIAIFSVIIFGCTQTARTDAQEKKDIMMEKDDSKMNIQLTGNECTEKGGEIVNTLSNPNYDKKLMIGEVVDMRCPSVCLKKEGAMIEKEEANMEKIRICEIENPIFDYNKECQKMIEEKYPNKECIFELGVTEYFPLGSCRNCTIKCKTEAMKKEEVIMMEKSYTGKVLAGTTTKYLDFNKADYEKALKEKKKILLYFYANWCPICKREQPETFAAFNEINDADLIGFRVNYRDSDTDTDEEALAKEFGVSYQHTKVLLKEGQRVGKFPDSWDKQRYLDELAKV